MVIEKCAFDPVRDIKAVEPFGFIDLKEAFATGVVPTVAPESDTAYNGIDNPDSILGKPLDIFDAMNMERAISGYKPEDGGNKEE